MRTSALVLTMAALTFASTDLVRQTYQAATDGYKVVAHEGSSGSSKTVSLAQVHLAWSFADQEKVFSVVRSTLPALKKGALRDWKRVLNWARIGSATGGRDYVARDVFEENRTDWVYTNKQTGTIVEFFGLDDPQKGRGPRRDRLWINEANESNYDAYRALAKRTRQTICLDYNPSMQRSWIYQHVLTREDCKHIHSTYRVNVFLSPEEVREIEVEVPVYELPDGERFTDWALEGPPHPSAALVAGDPFEWAVFGLGQRAAPGESVYQATYESVGFTGWEAMGLDFGFAHPAVLTRVGQRDVAPRPEMHFDQLVFGSGLDTDDLAGLMDDEGVSKEMPIYADGSRPESIKTLVGRGYNVVPADRSAGSVFEGIQFLRKHRLCFTRRSGQMRDQFDDYRLKKRPDGTVMDEPVKLNDDGPDAGRYGAYTHYSADAPDDWTDVETAKGFNRRR